MFACIYCLLVIGVCMGATVGEGELPAKTAAHSLCPVEMFEQSLRTLVNPPDGGMLPTDVDIPAVLDRYREGPARWTTCAKIPSAEWPMSTGRETPLIINVGEGSTATRFLNCVMRRVGLSGAHTKGEDRDKKEEATAFMGCSAYSSCTAGWDEFGYISDSPVVYQITELLATHPNALVLQSFRHPKSWKHSRITKHAHQGAADWHQGGICGGADHPMNHSMTELDFVVFNTWAHCISPKDDLPSRYLPINLFNQRSSVAILELLIFLRKHGMDLFVSVFAKHEGTLAANLTNLQVAKALEMTCAFESTLASGVHGPEVVHYSIQNGIVRKHEDGDWGTGRW